MVEDSSRRRLAAILAADVVGYSRLMEANEERTLGAVMQHRREFFEPTVIRWGGRIFKVMGDGFLVEFPSVINAARCAVEIQQGMLERNAGIPEDRHIKFRIGINLGDIIVDGDDFYGDGVNMAARLETLAWPGGIACSATVRQQVGNKIDLEFLDQGERSVKNIAQPVHVYFVNLGQAEAAGATSAALGGAPRLRSDRPSIAILPFANMSNDPEQEFFSDGITEDIITDLSKASGLFVLSRNTVFSYKGKTVPIEQIARDLGVAYVVEGSVRKAGQKVRINAQLIEGATGGHVWAERYDGDLNDIFALQDEITFKIVEALKVTILPSETKAIQAKATTNVEAYTWCLRGRELLNMHYQRHYPLARNMFAKAVEIDPSFAAAYAGIADCDSYSFLTRKDPATIAAMLDSSARAIELDPTLAAAYASRGLAYWSAGEPAQAEASYRKSLELDPNLYEANYFYGRYCRATGNVAKAADLFERAAEVRTADYKSVGLLQGVYELLGRQDAAASAGRRCVERVERELQSRPDNAIAAMHAAMALAALSEKARAIHFLTWAMSTEADDPSMLFNAACVYSRLGELNAALDLLERVHPLMPPADQAWTATDPDLTPLHGSPRFRALIDVKDRH